MKIQTALSRTNTGSNRWIRRNNSLNGRGVVIFVILCLSVCFVWLLHIQKQSMEDLKHVMMDVYPTGGDDGDGDGSSSRKNTVVVVSSSSISSSSSSSSKNNNPSEGKEEKKEEDGADGPISPIKATATATVAYAISLVKCSDHQSTEAGLIDTAIVMRHSIHQQSIRNHEESGSLYDYKMYAIVHRSNAQGCSKTLEDVGFTIVVVDAPIQPKEIEGTFLRKNIHKEWCCGSDEFIKLYAYTLPEPIIVHVDIDFLFYQPMDDLYNAMLFDKDSTKGQEARKQIVMERPYEPLPDRIDAYITRDWPQVRPGRKAGFQAGFMIVRHQPSIVQDIVSIVRKGNYTEGYSYWNGWGGLGYGGFVGAMAMQGLMAYYYDIVAPHHVVELNQCRYNHMGMDVKYNAHPNFQKNHPKRGQCRNDLDYCEDCTVTPLEQIYNIHYTECRKPWNCIGIGAPGGRTKGGPKANAIDTSAGNFDHCMILVELWHSVRKDLEQKLFDLTKDPLILEGQKGDYKHNIFQGHCSGESGKNYTQIRGTRESFQALRKLYE